jgi:hypothetical protein
VARSLGQEGRPQIVPQRNRPQDTKKPKKGKEPRALAVLEFNNAGKQTLIPVAILIDGKFYDASAYKADPIPMALERGTVYEVEQSGASDGLFTVNGALHSKSPGSAHSWVGTGTFMPKGTETPKTNRKAENVPVGLDSSDADEPPRLTRKDSSKKPAGGSDSNPSGDAGESGSAGKQGGTAPASPQPASGSSSGQGEAKSASPPNSGKSADTAGKQPAPAGQTSSTKGSNQSSSSGAEGPSDGDYYRPQLRRGKPTGPAPTEDEDKVTATKPSGNAQPVAVSSVASAAPLRMVAAISDAAGPEPQSYNFFWKTGEEEERQKQMLASAAGEVKAYAAALAKNQILARPVVPKETAGGHKTQTKQAQPVFENIQFRGFDVWMTGQPVMILSGDAHIPGAAGGSSTAADKTYSFMLVATTDIYGDLRKLYSGVTDKFHLDVTPRLELIDVVDADGDGRGELLFHETTDAGTGYVIYRATADKLWKMFDSLNAE